MGISQPVYMGSFRLFELASYTNIVVLGTGFLDDFVSNVLFLNNYPENRVGKPRLALQHFND